MIQVKDLMVSYHGSLVLDHITLTLNNHQIIMLLGENGAGKTTLIKSLARLIQPKGGTVFHNGIDTSNYKQKQYAALVSYVPQLKPNITDMTVEDCVVSGRTRRLGLFDYPSKEDYKKALHYMKQLEIAHLKDHMLGSLSGGELQLVYLCRALVQEAEVMVLDEPCTFLDYHKQHLFLELLKSQLHDNQCILMSIHDPRLALAYGDQLIVLHQGKVYATLDRKDGPMDESLDQIFKQLYGIGLK